MLDGNAEQWGLNPIFANNYKSATLYDDFYVYRTIVPPRRSFYEFIGKAIFHFNNF